MPWSGPKASTISKPTVVPLRTDERLEARGTFLGHESLNGVDELFAAHARTVEDTLARLLANVDVEDLLRVGGMSGAEVEALRHRLVDASGADPS